MGLLFLLALGTLGPGSVPEVQAQADPVALQGGRILTVTHGIIENGTIVMHGGRIIDIGEAVAIPADARLVDVSGKTVMPGLIDGFTNLGTADYPSLGPDDDEATDPVTPHMRVIDGLNPDNRFIPLAREWGVTAALSAPSGGNLFTGQSALVQLEGATVEEMVSRFPVGIHVTLGEAPKARYGANNRGPMTRMGSAALLRQTLVDALGYGEKISAYERKVGAFEAGDEEKKPAPVPRDLKLEALLPVVRGEKPLIIAADRYDDIYTALRVSSEFNVRMILHGGAESHRLAKELADGGIPVIWGPAAAPYKELEARRGTPRTPVSLADAGVPFAFQTGSVENVAGLLSEARLAFSNGLPYEEAVRGLTLYPAQIFGAEGELGSLEVGKSADVVVLSGDPLRESSRIEMVFVKGRRWEGLR
jgi:imidazolonepropionase-like amidohydrolase